MASLQLTAALLGLGLAFVIVVLVRRDHLHLSHGVFWIAIAAAAALLGVWPRAIDSIAAWVGVAYSPTLLLLIAVMVLLLKALYSDMLATRFERQIRRLNQRLAMLEVDLSKRTDP